MPFVSNEEEIELEESYQEEEVDIEETCKEVVGGSYESHSLRRICLFLYRVSSEIGRASCRERV